MSILKEREKETNMGMDGWIRGNCLSRKKSEKQVKSRQEKERNIGKGIKNE